MPIGFGRNLEKEMNKGITINDIIDYGMNIIMMHYPMLTWPKVMAGSIMLHGQ